MTNARYPIRPARKGDCRRIAELFRISSDGVADYIWSRQARPGEDLIEIGRRRYEREGTPFSYQNCRVVEHEGSVVGMLAAYPMEAAGSSEESDPVLAPYGKLEEDRSFYIAGMAIDEKHRGQGLGTMLLKDAERNARRLGLAKLSLIVFEQNAQAHRLYLRLGFVEAGRARVVPHPLIHHTGDVILMVKPVAAAS